MTIRAHIDIKENELLKIDMGLLEILLKDMTTGKNLVWATDNYAGLGKRYSAGSPITAELITGANEEIFRILMYFHSS